MPILQMVSYYASGLPSTYQEVEYIASSWNNYIDTWFAPNQNTKVEIKLSNWTESWSHEVIWVDEWWWNKWFSILPTAYCFNSVYDNIWWLADWNIHTCSLSQWWYIIDWTTVSTPSTTTFSNSRTLYIFALNRGTAREYGHFRLYYINILNNWTLVRRFIPCYRKSDSVIWLYDLVNNQFYTNSWSGTFTKWPDV